MYKNLLKQFPLHVQNVVITHQFLKVRRCALSVVFVWGYWYLLTRLHGVILWEYETILNTKYSFSINSKITALCGYNQFSGVKITEWPELWFRLYSAIFLIPSLSKNLMKLGFFAGIYLILARGWNEKL